MNYKSNPTTVKDLTKLDLDASQAALTKALSEMELEKHELEDQRSATLNILEDISESQKELQIKYKELKIIKNLIQNLGMTFKADLVMGYIIESIQELFPEVSVAYCNFLEEMPAPGPLLKIYPTLAIGSKYPITIINAVKKVLPSFKLSSAEQAPAAAFMRAEANYKLLSGKFSDGLEIVPNCQMTIPLKIDNIVRGLINFSSVSKDCTSQKNISFFTMILESADQTVEHLKNLVASEHSRLQDLINSMANGVLMFDLEGQVIAVNPTFRKFFGRLEAGSSLSYLIESLIRQNPEILEKFDISSVIDKVLKTAKPIRLDEVRLDGSVFEALITPVRDFAGKVTGGAIILHDITHIKEVEDMKTEFVSVASHQLRTPITAIKLFVEVLLGNEAGKLSKDQRDYLENIKESSARMIRLVNNLLNVSRIETKRLRVEPKLLDLADFIKSIITEIKPVAVEHKCKIIFKDNRKSSVKLMLDPLLLQQVINNIVGNAVYYSKPKAGDIRVEINYAERSEFKAELKGFSKGFVISVKDNGIGIPAEAKDQIFQKFFRADNAVKASTEGSGLGMYVAKTVVDAVGGKIWYESKIGIGTTFYIFLPESGMKPKEGDKSLIV